MHDFKDSERLTRFVEGGLVLADRLELQEHLASCDECTEWVSTYRVLADSLTTDSLEEGSEWHLTSDQVARLALASESLGEQVRTDCASHIESCSECADEVALARAAAAIDSSEQGDHEHESGTLPAVAARTGSFAAFRPLAWAASLLLAAGLVLLTHGSGGVPGDHLADGPTSAGQGAVEAGETLLVQATRVEAGSELTLKAESTVAFGDGFSVDSDGTLSVVIEEPQDS